MELKFNLRKKVRSHTALSLIKGITTREGSLVSCAVRVYSRDTGVLLSSCRSNENGSFLLFGSNFSENYILSVDPALEHNPATQDNIG